MSQVSERIDKNLPTNGHGQTLFVYDYDDNGQPMVGTLASAGDSIGIRAQEVFAAWLREKIAERQAWADATLIPTDRTIQIIRIDVLEQLLVDLEV